MLNQSRNRVLDGACHAKGQFGGGKGADHCKFKGPSAMSSAKTAELIEMSFGTWTLVGPRNPVLDGGSVVIRPHRSTTYVDAAYSYRMSSVVCRSVTLVSPAKTDAPIELPFELRTWVGPGNHVLDGVQIPHGKEQILRGEWAPIVKYRDTLRSSAQRRLNQ